MPEPRTGFTEVQWQSIIKAADDEGADLRALVDKAVRVRMAVAGDRGYRRGWDA